MNSVVLRGTDTSARDRTVSALHSELGDDTVLTASGLTVASGNADEVRAVVRIAGEHRVALSWAVGARPDHSARPAVRRRPRVTVDLRRMNRVLEIDAVRRRAVVEPGARWSDVYEALGRAGDGLWVPVPDLGWDGVVGDGLLPGAGYSPGREHLRGLCGTESVGLDGRLLRTGPGALAYGTRGIPTRLTWRLPRRPEVYTECWAGFTGPQALGRVLDALRDPRLHRALDGPVIMTRGFDFDENGVGGVDPDGDGWVARFRMCGRASAVDAGYATAVDVLRRAAGVRPARRTFRGDDVPEAARHDERLRGAVPDMDLIDPAVLPHGEGTAHVDFTPVGPVSGAAVARAVEVARSRCARHERNSVSTVVLRPGSTHQITTVFFNPRDPRQVRSVHGCYAGLVTDLAGWGHTPYRTNLRPVPRPAR
ncbi:FAD-binding oxidoreductase [Streptomyces sp. NPDC050988]|uniref:FAD-binding oxidoreductase n=1 Tax=Streptomyces sp. NPDC050988 TaxID=3365637 RepID=UPI0037996B94